MRTPAWVLKDAAIDLDFANLRAWGTALSIAKGTLAGYDPSSAVLGPANGVVGYAPNQVTGFLQTFPTYAPRISAGYGLWAEGKYTNFCLQNRTMTNASWTAVTCTVTKNQQGADGTANGAASLTATSTAATVLQTIASLTSATYVASAYVKRLTGTGAISMTMDGITYTAITSQINSNSYTRVSIPSQTLTSANCGFQLATNGDAIAVDFFQLENNAYPSTPLLTTTTSVARGTEEPAFGNPNGTNYTNDGYRIIRSIVCNGAPWSIVIWASGNTQFASPINTDGGVLIGMGTNGSTANFKASTGANTATTANNGVFGLGNLNKIACIANANTAIGGNSICLNGGAIANGSAGTSGISAASVASTHWGLGNNGAGAFPLDGYISRLAMWKRELTQGEMVQYST